MGSFEIKGSKGSFSFVLKADNNEIILTSESYTSKQSAEKGIEAVKHNAGKADAFKHHTSKDNKAYFTMVAENNEVIGTSETYSSKQKADEGIAAVKSVAAKATTVDHSK